MYIMCLGFVFQNTYVYLCTIMAEGGPMDETTPFLKHTGDDDDGDDNGNVNQGVDWDNTDLGQVPVNPFEPGAASTPAGGEPIPMATRTRLPPERGPGIAETSFGGEPTASVAWQEITGEFEMADESKLKARYRTAPRAGGGGGGAILEVSMKGKDKWYPLYTKSPGDVEKSFNESLPKEIKTALGKSLAEQFNDTNAALQAKQNELAAKQKQLEQA